MDLGPAREPIVENLHTLPEVTWIQPIPDPAEEAVARVTSSVVPGSTVSR